MDQSTSHTNDKLVNDAAIKLAELLSVKLGREITYSQVHKELYGMKYGVMTDDIPLNIEVAKALEENNISILYPTYKQVDEKKTFVNNPKGNRTRGLVNWDN